MFVCALINPVDHKVYWANNPSRYIVETFLGDQRVGGGLLDPMGFPSRETGYIRSHTSGGVRKKSAGQGLMLYSALASFAVTNPWRQKPGICSTNFSVRGEGRTMEAEIWWTKEFGRGFTEKKTIHMTGQEEMESEACVVFKDSSTGRLIVSDDSECGSTYAYSGNLCDAHDFFCEFYDEDGNVVWVDVDKACLSANEIEDIDNIHVDDLAIYREFDDTDQYSGRLGRARGEICGEISFLCEFDEIDVDILPYSNVIDAGFLLIDRDGNASDLPLEVLLGLDLRETPDSVVSYALDAIVDAGCSRKQFGEFVRRNVKKRSDVGQLIWQERRKRVKNPQRPIRNQRAWEAFYGDFTRP